MSLLALTRDALDEAVDRYPLLLIELTDAAADSTVEALAKTHPEVKFARAAEADAAGLRAMFGLKGPGLVIFRERVVLYCEPGVHSGERVAGLIGQVRELDMDAVRAAIEEEKRAAVALRMRRVCPTSRRGPLPES